MASDQAQDDKYSTTVIHRTPDVTPRRSIMTTLIGRPLPTADAPHQTIGKAVGLAVFASDALSSTAYATQEILVILAVAGTAAFGYAFPISIAIVTLMAIVTISYEQTIHAYPDGGGAYIVSRDNLGELPAQVAGSSLLTDYILTVAVSISSGVAQITSAFHDLYPYRVPIAVGMVMLIMILNLRGVRESGTILAIPSYLFIGMMLTAIITGVIRYFSGTLTTVIDPPELEMHGALQVLTPFIILHAFSSGTAALTGIEAISNGVTAFKEPRSRNAGITLIWMSIILATLFLGISFLSGQIHAIPSEAETVISQLGRTVFGGRNAMYLGLISATAVILILAANTAFAGFPRLGALLAKDGFVPRQLAFRGSRLVYSWGIITLSIFASLLIIAFNASVTLLIPLYAIGVFLSFSLSQLGMARRWWKIGKLKTGAEIIERGSTLHYESNWRLKMIINGFGAFLTAIVMLVFAWTKFQDGAWIVLIVIPLGVLGFSRIHRHYTNLAGKLSLDQFGEPTRVARHRVIMPVSGVHRGTLAALRYAMTLSSDITAVHVSMDPDEAEKTRKKWETWGNGVRLVVLDSPYRLLVEPLVKYIEEIDEHRQPNEIITIVVPEFIPASRWESLLHANAAFWLRMALLFKPGIVITNVPYQIE